MLTPAHVARAQEIAARLSTAGYEPRVTDHRDHIRVEADVSAPASPERWRRLLTALERGDRFGLDGTEDGSTAWAVVQSGTPATADTARGHGPQL